MADLENLGLTSITSMQNDEAIELLRQIRLSRRIPTKKPRKSAAKKEVKATINAEQAAEILKFLGGK